MKGELSPKEMSEQKRYIEVMRGRLYDIDLLEISEEDYQV